jgi:hypothetical protein
VLGAAIGCALLLAGARARADGEEGDPFAYNLRFALSPLAFSAAVTQSWFGSALRVEYEPVNSFELQLAGHVAWLNANHASALAHAYGGKFILAIHFSQSVREQPLYGTVYPADTPAVTGQLGTDHDLEDVPVNEKLRTALPMPRDRDTTLVASMRDVHSVRVGAAFTKVLQRARPDLDTVTQNELPYLNLGYSFATHWNLSTDVTGKREVGYRRFYGDLLLTAAGLVHADPARTARGGRVDTQPFGARIGMQGAMEGLLRKLPAVGVAYDLELGLYPGKGGLEGYLFLALGIALDVATASPH